MYSLDTDVVSELRRARPHGAVLSWFSSVSRSDLYVSAVAIGELQKGIEMTRRQDPNRARQLEEWLEADVLPRFTVLPFDAPAAREWARLMQGRSDTLMLDAMIAATAKVYGFQVVTRNVRDFDQLGVQTLNPFEFIG